MEQVANEELIPELEIDFLKDKEYTFEIIPSGGNILLIIRNFNFPEFYLPRISDLLIVLPSGYPNAAVDMFRTSPDIKLVNGNWPVAAEPHEMINGINWQQWSRHIGWRVGRDNLQTFISAIRKELLKGI